YGHRLDVWMMRKNLSPGSAPQTEQQDILGTVHDRWQEIRASTAIQVELGMRGEVRRALIDPILAQDALWMKGEHTLTIFHDARETLRRRQLLMRRERLVEAIQ